MNASVRLETVKSEYRWLPWGVIALALLAALISRSLETVWVKSLPLVWQISLEVSLLAAWLVVVYFFTLRVARILGERRKMAERVRDTERLVGEAYQRLNAVFRIRQQFVEAENEKDIIELLLTQAVALTGASGATFVPLDDHRHPLPPVSHGTPPVSLPDAWIEYLASPAIRSGCGACEKHNHFVTTCPLLSGPFANVAGLYCIPLSRGKREFGVLNVYIPDPEQLDIETRAFLNSLVEETAHALEAVWLRRQELDALHKLKAVRQKSELNPLLSGLLENLYQTLEPDFALLVLKDAASLGTGPDEGQEVQLVDKFIYGELPVQARKSVSAAVQRVLSSRELANLQTPAGLEHSSGGVRVILAAPMLVEQETVGTVLVGSKRARNFNQHQVSLLQTVAGQMAIVVQNANRLAELEYQTMMGERNRLAREIHDGLAQTLGFLKLQVAQMQGYLERGDTDKLKQGMSLSYHTISEAYQDARVAIDGLRISPGSRLEEWLAQMLEEFQENFDKQPLAVAVECVDLKTALPPEVQAQLIRIVQEALSNVRKHANASNILVRCSELNGDLVVEIQDDGRGFEAEDVPGPSKHGLRGMRERAELIGADFQVISRPAGGTIVRVSIPVPVGEVAL